MIVNTLYGLEEIADTKMCYSCKEIKHLDDFAHRGHRKDGTRETKNICKPCNNKQVKIPPGVGNGYCVLSHKAVVHYKWSFDGDYVDANEQFTVKWNDQKYYMNWPISNPILSERDK